MSIDSFYFNIELDELVLQNTNIYDNVYIHTRIKSRSVLKIILF